MSIASEALIAEFPDLFSECQDNIWIGEGWLPLVRELSAQIVLSNPTCRALQVKEKFGSLRFYVKDAYPTTQQLIALVEDASSDICDQCGDTGSIVRTNGWQLGRCEKHTNER